MLAVEMEGVTTAIVVAIFAGMFWPQAIKNRQQFYFAIGAVVVIVLLGSLDAMFGGYGSKFHTFVAAVDALLQIVGILGIILATSGQSVAEFAADTIEVVRRGEDETEVLIKGAGTRRARERDVVDDAGRIDLGSTDALKGQSPLRQNPPPPPPPPSAPSGGGPIPLDE